MSSGASSPRNFLARDRLGMRIEIGLPPRPSDESSESDESKIFLFWIRFTLLPGSGCLPSFLRNDPGSTNTGGSPDGGQCDTNPFASL